MRQFAKKQILFVHPRKASFIELDRELLRAYQAVKNWK